MKTKVQSRTAIFAAGGVLIDDKGQVAVIHRPRYNDWCLPKGKLKKNEDTMVAAVREVWEETNCMACPEQFLGTLFYKVKGKPKWVFYWQMSCDTILPFHKNSEVDILLWLSPTAAKKKLEHQGERDMVNRAVKVRRK